MIDLKGKKILITGTSSGIGKATALLCDQLGANTIITGRNTEALLDIQKITKNDTTIFTADLSNESEIDSLVQNISNIDGFVHCAGIVKPSPIRFIKSKNINEIFSINFNAAALLSGYLLRSKKINADHEDLALAA